MRNFKTLIRACVLIAAVVVFLVGLDLLLYPCTFTRVDVHAVTTGDYEDLYVGTSHGKMGIDPVTMQAESGRTGYNLCVGGEYSQDVYYLLKLILEKGHKPSRLVYEISPGYFLSEKEEGNNYLLFYHEFPVSLAKLEYFWDALRDCNFRTLFFPWYEYSLGYEIENAAETVIKKLSGDYGIEDLKSETQEYHEGGFVERYPVDTETLSMPELAEFHAENVSEQDIDYLERLIELCREQEIEFVALITPVPAQTLAVYQDSYKEADAFFEDFFAQQDVRYVNFNVDPYYDIFSHEIEDYTDYDGHLNGDAAREFSKILAQVLENTYDFSAPGMGENQKEIAG